MKIIQTFPKGAIASVEEFNRLVPVGATVWILSMTLARSMTVTGYTRTNPKNALDREMERDYPGRLFFIKSQTSPPDGYDPGYRSFADTNIPANGYNDTFAFANEADARILADI